MENKTLSTAMMTVFLSKVWTVLHAGWPIQPSSEALRCQSLRTNAHAGAHASRDAQTPVRKAAFCLSNFCISCCALKGIVLTF